jgi:hypothetical protein
MLSGPDLGGGYLHQLAFDGDGEAPTFTFHAQDGGSDAGGPPKGPLDVFGYVHPPSACMFGGPRCWHRRFVLPHADAARVRAAYNRGRFVLEAMIEQTYGSASVPIEAGLTEVVQRIGPALRDAGVPWYVGGSTAAWLQGARVQPHDIDLGTTRDGVDRLAELLAEYLIEPLAPTDRAEGGIVRGARAFVGTFREGVRVEWSVPLDPPPVARYDEWSGQANVARLESVTFRDHPIHVTRPEYALVRAAERGRSATVTALVDLLHDRGADRTLLAVLLERSTVPPVDRERLLAILTSP